MGPYLNLVFELFKIIGPLRITQCVCVLRCLYSIITEILRNCGGFFGMQRFVALTTVPCNGLFMRVPPMYNFYVSYTACRSH